jgi:hypothetical protein
MTKAEKFACLSNCYLSVIIKIYGSMLNKWFSLPLSSLTICCMYSYASLHTAQVTLRFYVGVATFSQSSVNKKRRRRHQLSFFGKYFALSKSLFLVQTCAVRFYHTVSVYHTISLFLVTCSLQFSVNKFQLCRKTWIWKVSHFSPLVSLIGIK